MKKGGFENVIPTGHTEGKINGGGHLVKYVFENGKQKWSKKSNKIQEVVESHLRPHLELIWIIKEAKV